MASVYADALSKILPKVKFEGTCGWLTTLARTSGRHTLYRNNVTLNDVAGI